MRCWLLRQRAFPAGRVKRHTDFGLAGLFKRAHVALSKVVPLMFEMLCRDEITFKRGDGHASRPHKCCITNDVTTTFDPTIDVAAEDEAFRPLPNGKTELFNVIKVSFVKGVGNIPDYHAIQVRKKGEPPPPKAGVMNTFNISNSHGIQIGDHNTLNIVNALEQTLQAIDKGNSTAEAKAEAKGLLRRFLQHPVMENILGLAGRAFAKAMTDPTGP
jgi:hypothetical protein